MARPPRIPSLRRHSRWQLGVVTLGGKDHYLGRWPAESPNPPHEVQAAYDRLVGEWLASGRHQPRPSTGGPGGVTVNHVIAAFAEHARTYYRHADGRATFEQDNLRQVLKRLAARYGTTPAADFDSLALAAFLDSLVREGLARTRVNRDLHRVRSAFKWAASRKLVDPAVIASLDTVPALTAGRSSARETEPVTPVPEAHVAAVLPRLSPVVLAMVRVQRLTGMRPGELVIMRGIDLDRSGPVWKYTPSSHKTAHRGRARVVVVGPKAQAELLPFLRTDPAEFLFRPDEAVGRAVDKSGVRVPGERYRTSSYGHAVRRACKRAGVPLWSPARLRHSFGTEVRRRFGLEGAGVTLGHAQLETSEIYAERDLELAERVALELG